MKVRTYRPIRRTLHYYFLMARHYKWVLLLNVLLPMAAIASGDIAFRYFLAILFGQLSQYATIPLGKLWHTFFLLMVLVGTQVVLWRINDYSRLKRTAKTQRDMERFVFDHLQAQSYRFFSDNFTGSLVTQFSRFLKSYETLEDIFLIELLIAATTLVFSIGVLLFIAPVLGLALLAWAVLFIGLIVWLTVKKSPISQAAATADSRITASVADATTNMLNIKIFARRAYEKHRFSKISHDRYDKHWRSLRFDAHIRNVRWAFVVIFLFLYIYLSIKLVTSGAVSFSAVLAGQLYIMTIYNQLFNLNSTIERIGTALADAAEMTEILDTAPEVKDPVLPENVAMDRGLIDFRSVNFRYPKTTINVLLDFDLTIRPGQKVGLVGHSGSGKSTLTRLLIRFADLQNGEITIDGQNIASVTQEDLRSHIAYVPQEPILFHRSLMENIRYGREGASDEEVHEAARLAYAADFIEALPGGYETLVGERGIKLSGGEKQRVAIARAMLSTAPIMVLDEATSALDSKSEKLITTALNELMKNRTTIVIAHRLSTIRKMDRVLVMKNGTIIEDGDHKTLLNKKGIYAELWAHQSGGFLGE